MARRSIAEIADQLDERGDELTALPTAELPSLTHQIAVDTMLELIELGGLFSKAGGDAGPYLTAMIHTLQRSRPILVESISKVPKEAVREFMRELAAKVSRIVDAEPDPAVIVEGVSSDRGDAADPHGAAQAG